MVRVSVIIVSMNRPDYLFPCLDGLMKWTSVPMEVLVTTYRFSTQNLVSLMEHYPWVKIIDSRDLRGFSENNNLALREAKGEYCFIVNDDTLMDRDVIGALLSDFGRMGPEAAAVSPRIVFPDGSVQTCGRAPWTAWRYMMHYLHQVDETQPTRWSMQEGLFRTWTLNGACFLIRTEAFRKAGWFDETYTFTPEDIALGHRLNEMGYTVWADAGVDITHLAGGTVSRMEAVIKPTRVRGALLFYSGGRKWKYALLGAFVWAVEACRRLKYHFADREDPSSHAAIMYRTAGNVMRSVFTRRSAKEIFEQLFKELG